MTNNDEGQAPQPRGVDGKSKARRFRFQRITGLAKAWVRSVVQVNGSRLHDRHVKAAIALPSLRRNGRRAPHGGNQVIAVNRLSLSRPECLWCLISPVGGLSSLEWGYED
jgi:hypothetical protein